MVEENIGPLMESLGYRLGFSDTRGVQYVRGNMVFEIRYDPVTKLIDGLVSLEKDDQTVEVGMSTIIAAITGRPYKELGPLFANSVGDLRSHLESIKKFLLSYAPEFLQGDAGLLAKVLAEHEKLELEYNRLMLLRALPEDLRSRYSDVTYQQLLPIYSHWLSERQGRQPRKNEGTVE